MGLLCVIEFGLGNIMSAFAHSDMLTCTHMDIMDVHIRDGMPPMPTMHATTHTHAQSIRCTCVYAHACDSHAGSLSSHPAYESHVSSWILCGPDQLVSKASATKVLDVSVRYATSDLRPHLRGRARDIFSFKSLPQDIFACDLDGTYYHDDP